MSITFLVFLGGGGIFVLGGGGGKCRFYFYGRADFSDKCIRIEFKFISQVYWGEGGGTGHT